jgi:hypothetical protein
MAKINSDGSVDKDHPAYLRGMPSLAFKGSYLTSSVNRLTAMFGEPERYMSDSKTSVEWFIETPGGDVFAIYDWKEEAPAAEHPDVEYQFHIDERRPEVGYAATRFLVAEGVEIMDTTDRPWGAAPAAPRQPPPKDGHRIEYHYVITAQWKARKGTKTVTEAGVVQIGRGITREGLFDSVVEGFCKSHGASPHRIAVLYFTAEPNSLGVGVA